MVVSEAAGQARGRQMKKVLVTDRLAGPGLDYLQSRSGLEVEVATGREPEELPDLIRDADALVVRSGTKVTRELIEAGERLAVIGRAGIGVDNIDVEAATDRGVLVLNTADANATTTAELAIAHIFSLSRNLPQADRSVRSGQWQRSRFSGRELTGKTVGVVGFGTIGRIVASRCIGLQMRVVGHDPFVKREVFESAGVEPAELDELLAKSDYVTIHTPLNDRTRGLINASNISLMGPGAFLINCARGGIVDEGALVEALSNGKIAGAALDVFEREPPVDSPLLELENVVLTPHLGASTAEAQTKVAVAIARQVAAFLESGEAIGAINLPAVTSEQLARLRPYQLLARGLGRLLAHLCDGPLDRLEVGQFGRAAELESRPVAVEALVGLLRERMGDTVNNVNAQRVARRHGISLVESRSDEIHDHVSLLTVTARNGDEAVSVSGTLLDERHPRLVRLDRYKIEAVLQGVLLMTRHHDQPGVIGALGSILGRRSVNISRMHLGLPENGDDGREAIALLAISRQLDAEELAEVRGVDAIEEVIQVVL
jgi:D-3-phosphoglycerate dehydrogenase